MTDSEYGQRQTPRSVQPREADKPPTMPDPEYRLRIEMGGRRAGKSVRLAEARARHDAEQEAIEAHDRAVRRSNEVTGRNDPTASEVLGVLTGQVPIQINPPVCPDHKEVQHRDRKPPWCNKCGWSHGRPAVPARPLGSPRE